MNIILHKKLLYLLALLLIVCCKKEFAQPPSPGRMIKSFILEEGQYGTASIYNDSSSYKILVRLTADANPKALKPVIEISDGASIQPASGETIDVSSSKKVVYTVIAASGQSRKWEVEFREYESAIGDYGTYSITSTASSKVMQVQGNLSFNEKYVDNAAINVANPEITNGENLKRWQEWDIIYNSSAEGIKYYQMRNLNSGMFLDAGNNANPGQQVRQKYELKTDNDQQLWSIQESTEAGKYEILNKSNRLYLMLTGSGNNLQVTQETKQSTDQQRWQILNLPKDSYRDGDVNKFFSRTKGSVAFDQGNSIPLSDGRVLWVTQDAWYQGSLAPNGNLYGNQFISYTNSIIIQPAIGNWSPEAPMMTADGRSNGGIGNLIAKQPGKTWSWPGPGVQIGNTVYIQNREGNGLGTEDDNQSIFKLTPSTATHWNVERTTPPGLTASEKLITYSTGMVKASDDYVYVFGSRTDPDSFGYATYLHVARFPQSDPQNWTFWNGGSWEATASVASAARVNTGLGTNDVSYINGKYLHLTMDQGFYCGIPSINMYISTSVSPTGPFTARKLVYTFTEFYKGYNAKVYTPLLHVESVNGRNELLVTYSLNYGACQGQNDPLFETDGNLDPYYYRVKGVRIPYEMIGL